MKNKIISSKLKLINILNNPGNSIKFREKDPIIINPNQNIYEIMNILKDFVGESIPVVNDKNKLIGVISENDVLKAYDQITSDNKKYRKKLKIFFICRLIIDNTSGVLKMNFYSAIKQYEQTEVNSKVEGALKHDFIKIVLEELSKKFKNSKICY